MTSMFGNDWNRDELLQRVGRMDQIAGIRLLEAADGLERGCRILEVWTGSGLEFAVSADRAMDICTCRYKGIPLAWASPVGGVHPAYYEPQSWGWLRSFPGGLLITCGLDAFGAPTSDADEDFGLHGRVSNLPARSVNYRSYWEESAAGQSHYKLEITGEVRQTRPFGENLLLQRRISTQLGSSKILIEDVVTNDGFASQPHMILYHFNLGFPLISEDSRLHLEAEQTVARDADAEAGLAHWNRLQAPTAGYSEQVFRHVLVVDEEGKAHIEVENPTLGVGLRWSYKRASLPHLFQWKMMGQGMYVLGIEPGNCSAVEGRAIARERDDLPHLEPGESRRYALELEVTETPKQA